FVLSQDQTLHEIWKALIGSLFILVVPRFRGLRKRIADCYVRSYQSMFHLEAFASQHLACHTFLHDILHCLVFKEHPAVSLCFRSASQLL
ncbi:MAG: hypothetical protein II178_02005, partial [Selenomonadaceae bacterium]|nr:hypothetical protein [Selenomonadaceae bacterium]